MEDYSLKRKVFDISIIIMLSIVPRWILCLFAYPVRTVHDEIATIAGAALYAGNDWSSVMSNAYYYGFGMSILLAPVFKMSNNPIIIYRVMIMFCSLLQGSTAMIAFHVLKRYFQITERKVLILISVICSYAVVTRGVIVYNEHALIFVSWIIIWILLYLHEHINFTGKKVVGTITLIILSSYALTLHTRAMIFIISLIIFIIFYKLIYKKWIVNIPSFLFGILFGIITAQLLVKQYQNFFWGHLTKQIENTEVTIVSPMKLLSDAIINASFKIIIGQVSTLTIVTGGLFCAGIVLWFVLLKKETIGRRKRIFVDTQEKKLLIIFSYCLLCIGMTMLAQALSPGWASGVAKLIQENSDKSGYPFKAITYVRYVGPYIGPFIMATLIFLHNNKVKTCEIYKTSLILILFVEYIWIFNILPYMYECKDASEAFLPFTFGETIESNVSKETFLVATFMLMNICIVCYILYNKGKKVIVLLIIALLYIYQYFYNGINYDICVQESNYLKINSSYKLIMNLESRIEFPKEIYVYDVREEQIHKTFYLYQFYFNQYKIIPQIPEAEEALLFINSDNLKDKLLKEGYIVEKISNFEYICIKGKDLQNQYKKFEEKQNEIK